MAPPKSRVRKLKQQQKQIDIIQSRKAHKKLEKIVLKKKSKVDRAKLLNQLKECQLKPQHMETLHSTTAMQTRGLKRFMADGPKRVDAVEGCLDVAILLGKKRRRLERKMDTSSTSSEDTDAVSTDTEEEIPSDDVVEKTCEKTCEDELNNVDQTKESRLPEPAVFISVKRLPEVEKARLELPIIGEEQSIMEKIHYHDIVVISGETGSGKTTQLPQFLYEAGYTLNGKLIGITEPRRVAAVSMSERVGHELNLTSDEVSYQIRFSGNVSSKTQIKFMTDGVLLRECQEDFLLSKYSALIIDEAHERSVFSDILIGLLSRIVPMRAKREDPLKLIIMSATLRVKDFTENTFLFPKIPPVIKIDARQYPVTVNFARKTPPNYLQAAFRKICSVHSKMPKGGILVFVTSQNDVRVLCRKLKEKFPIKDITTKASHVRRAIKSRRDSNTANKSTKGGAIMENLKNDICFESDEEEIENDDRNMSTRASLLNISDLDSESDDDGTVHSTNMPLHCLGLYAMLPMEKQQLVFKDPPDGTRLCVIATNVAETSITIPNIKYVIDSGKEKTKIYDLVTGVSRFETKWTTKSSAEQRMGRAGRMGPGHCYRLFSSAVFTNDFTDHAQPKILQKPVEDVLLQMKSMNIDNVVNFPFPTRPPVDALMAAEKKLILLDALDDSVCKKARAQDRKKTEFTSRPTPLGKAMSSFAVSARCSKMIVLSPSDLLCHVVALVSALTVREMFVDIASSIDIKKRWAGHGPIKKLGDFMVMLKAVSIAETFGCSNKQCLENGLRTKAMLEIDKLRRQLTNEINKSLSCTPTELGMKVNRPSNSQAEVLRQLLLSSFCDHVARKLPDGEIIERDANDPSKAEKRKLKNAYECMEADGPVYISPESVLKGDHPEYIIYKELYQGDKKMFMRDIAVIESDWLPYYAHKLCHFSDPSSDTKLQTEYDRAADQVICYRSVSFGSLNWSLGSMKVPMDYVESGVEIYKEFAKFLLSGEVIDWFKKYSQKLLLKPYVLTKPWFKFSAKTQHTKILTAIINAGVKSRGDLNKTWRKDSNFLKQEYMDWLPESLHHRINSEWDQMQQIR